MNKLLRASKDKAIFLIYIILKCVYDNDLQEERNCRCNRFTLLIVLIKQIEFNIEYRYNKTERSCLFKLFDFNMDFLIKKIKTLLPTLIQ